MKGNKEPLRRSERLVTRTLGSEVVTYDLTSEKVTHLDGATARVWQLCDGQRSTMEIAHEASLSRTDVEAAQGRLYAAGLMAESGLSRRRFLAGATATASLVPLVSIAAPSAAMAQSAAASVEIAWQCRSAHASPITITIRGVPGSTVYVTYNVGTFASGDNVPVTIPASGVFEQSFSTPTTGKPVQYVISVTVSDSLGTVLDTKTATTNC